MNLSMARTVLVRDADDAIIGAVGISGNTGDIDEACAIAGIRARACTVPDEVFA
jgi:uncharacterized protein GlcG (DUF336 family)